jgi:8-oxo-dGTP pyrophosphatase MutT (NUDIX family)
VDSTPPWTDEPEHWPVHASEDIWRGSAPFAVRRDTISRPGHPDDLFGRLVVEHPGAVVILAVDDSGDTEQVMVLRQYRHPSNLRFVELPAGLLDVPGEPPVGAAARELAEEVDLLAARWEVLVDWFNSPGGMDEAIRVFLARELSPVPQADRHVREHEERDMVSEWVALDDARDAVLAGRVHNPTAVAGVLAACAARDAGWTTLRPADAPWPEHKAYR